MGLIQETQRIQKLLSKDSNQRGAQAAELILLDQFVKVDTEQLKDQAEMLSVNESILQPE